MKIVRALVAAFSYFSILPVRSFATAPDAAVIGWLPLVGAAIGAVSGYAAQFAAGHTHGPIAYVVVAFVASIVFSGAIHVDGFLDCADALVMTAPASRRLDVLHDPRHGTYAVVAMAMLTVVWIGALTQIAPEQIVAMLVVAAAISRAAVLPLAGQYRHARSGRIMPTALLYGLVWLLVLALVSFVIWRVWQAPLVVAIGYLCAQACGAIASRRLGGGLTGDVYGAVVVVTEVALLIVAPSMLPHL